jgi:hypothetical protein
MDVVSQKTQICKRNPENAEQLFVLLALDGVAMNIDVGGLLAPTSTALLIEGARYLPIQSVIEITSGPDGCTIVTTIVVVPN